MFKKPRFRIPWSHEKNIYRNCNNLRKYFFTKFYQLVLDTIGNNKNNNFYKIVLWLLKTKLICKSGLTFIEP